MEANIKDVFIVSDDSDAESSALAEDMDLDTEVPLFEQVKSIVDKELIVYTTRLEQMLIPCQGNNISLERIEKASKPFLKQLDTGQTRLGKMPIPFHGHKNIKEECIENELEQTQHIMPDPLQDHDIKVECISDQIKPALINTYIPFQDSIKSECMEISSKDPLKQTENIIADEDLWLSMEDLHELQARLSEDKAECKRSSPEVFKTSHKTLHRGLCKPMNVTLTDYRKYPVLSTKEIYNWNTFCKTQRQNSQKAKLDHIVKIVNVRSGITDIFHMGDHGILKVETGPNGSFSGIASDIKNMSSIFEINVCCWYSKIHYLKELYVQLELGNVFVRGEKEIPQDLSRYLPHFVMLCGNHKCPQDSCSCCGCCIKKIWNLNTDGRKPGNYIIRAQKSAIQYSSASRYLLTKALAYTKNRKNHSKESGPHLTKQVQLNEVMKNVLLEIRHVRKNDKGTIMVDKLRILDIGPNGQIESFVEKRGPDFIVTGLVDDNKKKNSYTVCCWNKLQTVISALRTQNYLPEVYQFIREKHTCPIQRCNCCCWWNQGILFQKPEPFEMPTKIIQKGGISVKPLKSLINKRKPQRREIKQSMVITPKSKSQVPVTALASAFRKKVVEDNTLQIKQLYVPPGTPVNSYGVNSRLMQSIIDEEIARLVETNSVIPMNVVLNRLSGNGPSAEVRVNQAVNTVVPEKTFNETENNPIDVPEATEVNGYIKNIIDKFKDIRFTLNKKGNVTAVISNPPATAGDVTLLKNLLEKIQALLDKQTEKSNETLSTILGLPQSQINYVPVVPFSTQIGNVEMSNLTKQCLNKTHGTPDTLANLIARAPIPPNFPNAGVHSDPENGIVYLYKESEDIQFDTLRPEENCLDNIKIAKIESMTTRTIDTIPQEKAKVRVLAKTKLSRFPLQRKQTQTPQADLVASSSPPLVLVSTPASAIANSAPVTHASLTSAVPVLGIAGVPTLSSTSHGSDQTLPFSVVSPANTCIPSSSFVTSVPTYVLPINMPTVKVNQNLNALKAPLAAHDDGSTILIPDDDDDVEEAIL